MDNTQITGSLDRHNINLNQDHEIQYWADKFKVSPEQLKEAAEEANSSSVLKIEHALVSLGYIKRVIT